MGISAGSDKSRALIVVRPYCELHGRGMRLENVLWPVLEKLQAEGHEITLIEKVSELETVELDDSGMSGTDMRGQRIIFAVPLSEAGVNMEYYRLLEFFRLHPHCLEGSVGGIVVDGSSELFTKALARRLAFSANMAGCVFPGKPLVEATGSLGNFHVLSQIRNEEPIDVYREQLEKLFRKVIDFEWPTPTYEPLNILAIHASSRKTSNTLLLWDKVKKHIVQADGPDVSIEEISLRNGTMTDCRGCPYETCLHFGEKGRCFYGGIMVEKVFPAILRCDVLVMICPNYNDAVSANITAFINRLTALFHSHDLSHKRVYAIVVSGYSGGDIVAEQILGAINFNKNFILPARFAMVETANDPKSILTVPDIDKKAAAFADRIVKRSL
jgi:multimeric flavodoxin WrbA